MTTVLLFFLRAFYERFDITLHFSRYVKETYIQEYSCNMVASSEVKDDAIPCAVFLPVLLVIPCIQY